MWRENPFKHINIFAKGSRGIEIPQEACCFIRRRHAYTWIPVYRFL
jgi:hypothetical protein